MRELKFRAFNTREKEMVFFDALKAQANGLVNFPCFFSHQFDFPIMQYTGLKDKNGKEIYEGDVLEHPVSRERFVINWSTGYCGFRGEYKNGIDGNIAMQVDDKGLAVIIGNIYENPELLEQ